MRALIKYGEMPGETGLRDIPEPSCGPFELKIEVSCCAVCATDLHIRQGAYPWETGVPLGHEFCGTVIECGAGVKRFHEGDRVAACMNGGFAKYVVKSQDDFVFLLPPEISDEEGALLEPLCAAANSVWNRALLQPGDEVLVAGPGLIGLFVLQIAHLYHAHVMVSGTSEARLKAASELGAERTVHIGSEDLVQASLRFSEGRGMDVVFECSGSAAAFESGLDCLRYQGQLVELGIMRNTFPVDMKKIVYHNLSLSGSIAYDRETWERVIRLVKRKKIEIRRFISGFYSLEEWEEAFCRSERHEGYRFLIRP